MLTYENSNLSPILFMSGNTRLCDICVCTQVIMHKLTFSKFITPPNAFGQMHFETGTHLFLPPDGTREQRTPTSTALAATYCGCYPTSFTVSGGSILQFDPRAEGTEKLTAQSRQFDECGAKQTTTTTTTIPNAFLSVTRPPRSITAYHRSAATWSHSVRVKKNNN